jgi:hypothetical protein
MKLPLEEYLNKLEPEKKQYYVDEAGVQTFSLIAGTILDFTAAGLGVGGSAVSRLEGAFANRFTGGQYGNWRDKWYKWTKTNESSSEFRKYGADVAAFETFQVPLYGAVVTIASVIEQIIPGVAKDGLDYFVNANYQTLISTALNQGIEGMKGAAK